MKHIINYLGTLLAVVLIGATFTACSEKDGAGSGNVGLGIKTFFPTKVVTNQPMTINGSGFDAVTEIEFPNGVKVTNFEIVSNDMIRVDAPAGIAAEGGKLIVRTGDGEAESRQSLTIGHINVTGFSLQQGETANGGDLITIYGKDLESIKAIELLDADGNPQLIDQKDFYRKGTSSVIFRVPLKNIYDGTFVGTIHTYDGQQISLPELVYVPSADDGHMEIVKTVFWKNEDPEGNGAVNWNGTYRFALDGKDGNNECIATFPEDIWNKIKTGTFFIKYTAADPTSYQVRVTTGWWGAQWLGKDNDIAPWNMAERIIDNGDGTFYIEVRFEDDPIVADLDDQHLLFTGSGYTPLELYFEEEIWVDGPGDQEVKVPVWKNDGSAGAVSWNGTYRFALDGKDGNNECIATFSEDIWNRIKTEKFYITYTADDPTSYQVRVTTGWWGAQWLGKDNDIAPWNMADRIIDNGDGTFTIEVEFGDDPIVADLDDQHLLFTGNGYTLQEIYFIDIVKGGGGPKEVVFWQGDGSSGAISWNGTYRFGLDGKDGNNECIATFPEDIWNKIKTGTFYMQYSADDPTSYQVRVTTGWWGAQWLGKDNDIAPWNMAERIIDNGDGTFTIEVKFGDDPIVADLDDQHLLFTGNGYTPLKLYFLE